MLNLILLKSFICYLFTFYQEIKNVCQQFHSELNDTANKAIIEKDPYLGYFSGLILFIQMI